MEIFGYHPDLKKWTEIGNSGMFRPEMLLPMGLPKVNNCSDPPTMLNWSRECSHTLWPRGAPRGEDSETEKMVLCVAVLNLSKLSPIRPSVRKYIRTRCHHPPQQGVSHPC